MTNSKLTSLLVIVILSINIQGTLSQVRIGIDEAPLPGALLQVANKKNDSGEINSTGGIGLPRVFLESRTALYPMFQKDGNGYKGYDKTEEDSKHIGLLVYNVNQCFDYLNSGTSGTFVWDGKQWIPLISSLGDGSKLKVVADHEGNLYHYASFGPAGEWMVENLRTKTYPNNDPAPTALIEGEKIGYTQLVNKVKKIAYPHSKGKYWDTEELLDRPEIGLLYNWFAASNNENIVTSANLPPASASQASLGKGQVGKKYEVEMMQPNHYVQGICPDGWHIPSTHDWNMLEREMYDNAPAYSTLKQGVDVFNGATWQENDPALAKIAYQGWRGSVKVTAPAVNQNGTWADEESHWMVRIGHGAAMKTGCLPSGKQGAYAAYASLPPAQGGFSVTLTGKVNGETDDGIPTSLKYYGANAFFWTSSISGTEIANNEAQKPFTRYFGANSTGVAISVNRGHTQLNSIRCKKNEPWDQAKWEGAWVKQ